MSPIRGTGLLCRGVDEFSGLRPLPPARILNDVPRTEEKENDRKERFSGKNVIVEVDGTKSDHH